MVVERIDALKALAFEQAASLPEAQGADFTIEGKQASVTTFRYTNAFGLDGKVLVVVLAARPSLLGMGSHHIEQGLVFSEDGHVRSASDVELQNSGG